MSDIDKLKSIYYNPELGFKSLEKLIEIAENHNLDLTRKEIKKFYDQQVVNQIYSNNKINYLTTLCPFGPGACLQIDLMDISRFYSYNKPYRYLLNIVDVYSRYAWVNPLESKNSEEITNIVSHLTKEINKINPNVKISITTDNGKEFVNNNFKKIFNKNYMYKHYTINTKQSTSNKPGKTAIVERFNRTLWDFIKKYTSSYNTLSFVDIIPKFLKNYNNSIHSSTKQTPISILEKKNLPDFINTEISNNFEIGDYVRIKNKEKIFDKKSFLPKYSVQIYEIMNKEGNQYILKNIKNGKTLVNKYSYRDLKKIDINTDINDYDITLLKNKKYNRNMNLQKKEPAFRKSSLNKVDDEGIVTLHKNLRPKDNKRESKQTHFYY